MLQHSLCCSGALRWCPTCGGTGFAHLLGIAQTNGALWAERYREVLLEHDERPPASWPGTIEHARARMERVTELPRLREWLAGKCLEAATAQWKLVASSREGIMGSTMTDAERQAFVESAGVCRCRFGKYTYSHEMKIQGGLIGQLHQVICNGCGTVLRSEFRAAEQ